MNSSRENYIQSKIMVSTQHATLLNKIISRKHKLEDRGTEIQPESLTGYQNALNHMMAFMTSTRSM